MTWCGKRVDEMTEDELRTAVAQMAEYIRILQERISDETDRTIKWMGIAKERYGD